MLLFFIWLQLFIMLNFPKGIELQPLNLVIIYCEKYLYIHGEYLERSHMKKIKFVIFSGILGISLNAFASV